MPHDTTPVDQVTTFATAQEFWEQADRGEWSNDEIFDKIHNALTRRRSSLVDTEKADGRYGIITQAVALALDMARMLREGTASEVDLSDLLQAADLLLTVALDDEPYRILAVRVVHVRSIEARMTGDEQRMRHRRPIAV